MSERAPYSRVYWSVLDDPKFDSVYGNDAAFALWVRLLINADALWPSPAPLPRSIKAKSLTVLVDAGLVDLLARDRYRIHGLDSERGRRRDAARTPPKREPLADQTVPERDSGPGPKTRRDEHSQDEPTRAEGDDDGRADLEAFLLLRRRAPTPKQRRLLDEVMDRHDLTGPEWAADIMMRHPDDPIGAVIEADREYRAERIAEAQAAEKPKPKARRSGSGLPETARELLTEWAASKAETPS